MSGNATGHNVAKSYVAPAMLNANSTTVLYWCGAGCGVWNMRIYSAFHLPFMYEEVTASWWLLFATMVDNFVYRKDLRKSLILLFPLLKYISQGKVSREDKSWFCLSWQHCPPGLTVHRAFPCTSSAFRYRFQTVLGLGCHWEAREDTSIITQKNNYSWQYLLCKCLPVDSQLFRKSTIYPVLPLSAYFWKYCLC